MKGKKITRTVTGQVGKSVALTSTKLLSKISVADMISEVKDYFDDTFSNDVYDHFGLTRNKTGDFSKGLQFSLKSTSATSTDAYYGEVLRENKNLKMIISLLDDMQYSSVRSKVELNAKDIYDRAGRMLKEVSSKYDRKQFADELYALYDYMQNAGREGRADKEEIFKSLMNLANRVLEKSESRTVCK